MCWAYRCIFLDTMEYFPVEVQLRTMAMDFWASMEHRVCYKKQAQKPGAVGTGFLPLCQDTGGD